MILQVHEAKKNEALTAGLRKIGLRALIFGPFMMRASLLNRFVETPIFFATPVSALPILPYQFMKRDGMNQEGIGRAGMNQNGMTREGMNQQDWDETAEGYEAAEGLARLLHTLRFHSCLLIHALLFYALLGHAL